MRVKPIAAALAALALGATATGTSAQETENLVDAIGGGKVHLDLRYRYEFVDQDGFRKDAGASTLRSRLGYTSGVWQGFNFLVEFDNVASIGSERYNSTENGETDYPVVADPTGTDVNQALISYTAGGFNGKYGRQRILHGNQRFIGGVGFRQNEQTYDGFRAAYGLGDAVKLDYSYVYNVNRIFGPDDGANPADLHGSNHFAMADWAFAEGHTLKGFAYLLDFDTQSGYAPGKNRDLSSDTVGVEYNGKIGGLGLHAAYASQSDGGDSALDYDADYYAVDASYTFEGVKVFGGLEVLGAGDGVGFATPLATLHKFQGWADKFLGTPGDGLEDIYLGASGKLGPVKLEAIYHDFSAEDSSDDFGTEWNIGATWPVTKQFTTALKAADFSSDNKARYADTTKVWLTLQFKL